MDPGAPRWGDDAGGGGGGGGWGDDATQAAWHALERHASRYRLIYKYLQHSNIYMCTCIYWSVWIDFAPILQYTY